MHTIFAPAPELAWNDVAARPEYINSTLSGQLREPHLVYNFMLGGTVPVALLPGSPDGPLNPFKPMQPGSPCIIE